MPPPPGDDRSRFQDGAEALRRYLAAATDPRGRDESFHQLVRLHETMVRAACRRMLGDDPAAEDAVQATFIVLAQRAHRLRDPLALPAWLHRTAVRMCQAERRSTRRRRRKELAAGEPRTAAATVPDELERAEVRACLDEAIERLSAAQRLVVVRHYLEQRTHDEIAAELGINADAARMRCGYALERLRRLLRPQLAALAPAVLLALLAERASAAAATTVAVTPKAAALAQAVMRAQALKALAAAALAAALIAAPVAAIVVRQASAPIARTYRVGLGGDVARLADLPPLRSGDVVEVLPGVHHERFDLRAPDGDRPVTVVGVGGERPVIDADGLGEGRSLAALSIAGGRVIVRHLAIVNAHGDLAPGIEAVGAAAVTIDDCAISRCDMGVNARRCGRAEIVGCDIGPNGDGARTGTAHNVAFSGVREAVVRSSSIHDALDGENIWAAAGSLAIASSTIARAQHGGIEFSCPFAPGEASGDARLDGVAVEDARGPGGHVLICSGAHGTVSVVGGRIRVHGPGAGAILVQKPVRLRLAGATIDCAGSPIDGDGAVERE